MLTRRLRDICAAMSPRNFWKKKQGWEFQTRTLEPCGACPLHPGGAKMRGNPSWTWPCSTFRAASPASPASPQPDGSSQQFPTVPYDFNAQLYKSDREESGTVWNMNNIEKWWPACIKVYMIHMESIEPTARISRRPLRGQTSQQSETPYFHHLLCPQILEAV